VKRRLDTSSPAALRRQYYGFECDVADRRPWPLSKFIERRTAAIVADFGLAEPEARAHAIETLEVEYEQGDLFPARDVSSR